MPQRKKVPLTRPEIPAEVNIYSLYWKKFKVYTEEQKTKAWSDAAGMVQTYSDDMIERWNKEIDTYLVFAGLFSANLTAFNVQSYLLLQPAPPDPSIAILQQISSQLWSFSTQPFDSSPQPSGIAPALTVNTPPRIPRWAIWLNSLWFSGLILSLTSASVGIMVKQWLNEYSSGVSGTSRPAARVRQHRLNNLKLWHVEDVVGVIPVLLQLALAFFLSGLLILLWNYNDIVAAIASALVGLLAVFAIISTLLPLFNHNCSYITPQIRALNSVWQPKRYIYCLCASASACIRIIAKPIGRIASRTSRSATSFDPHLDWYFDFCFRPISLPFLRPVSEMLLHLATIILRPDDWGVHKQTWQGRERSAIDKQKYDLDKQTLLDAYSVTLHPHALSAASTCLMDFYAGDVVDYFRQLHKSSRLKAASPDDARDAHTRYLQSVDHFLECANRAFKSVLPAKDLEAVRSYTQHVLMELTHTLLELLSRDKMRITVESRYLDDVMCQLRSFDDACLEDFIHDDVVPDIVYLANRLSTTSEYSTSAWAKEIQESARVFMENITRIKCNPGMG
ncbi:hypothetical protein VTO73DRAFT_12743 [Trametes versicolor]